MLVLVCRREGRGGGERGEREGGRGGGKSSVLCIGAGGLGSPIALYLAGAGVGL